MQGLVLVCTYFNKAQRCHYSFCVDKFSFIIIEIKFKAFIFRNLITFSSYIFIYNLSLYKDRSTKSIKARKAAFLMKEK